MKEIRRYLRTLRGQRGPLLRTVCLMAAILGLLLYVTRHHHELHTTKPLYFVSIGELQRHIELVSAPDKASIGVSTPVMQDQD